MFGSGVCCFVMLNPSTADAERDDPTITRCLGFAAGFKAAELQVVNLFAYRSTDPAALHALSRDAAVGPGNDEHIARVCAGARLVICAWGNLGALHGRSREALGLIRSVGAAPLALRVNKGSGEPAHPLYLPANSVAFAI